MAASIEVQVEAVNLVRGCRQEIYDLLIPAMKEFDGCKVVLKTGGFSKKFKDALPEIPKKEKLQFFLTAGFGYSIRIEIKACVQAGEFSCHYYEESLYLCDLTDGAITRVYDRPKDFVPFTSEEIYQRRLNLKEAKKAYEDAQSALFPFTEY